MDLSRASDIKVSVRIVCYNQEAYITRALDSVLEQQTDFGFEVIVIDDCSTDRTSDIVARYALRHPGRVIHIRHSVNRYAEKFDNLHREFLPIAKGKYFCHLEGDDYWIDPNKLQHQADTLDAHPEAGGCITGYIIHNEITGESREHRVADSPTLVKPKNVFILRPHVNTLMYRRELIENPDSRFQKLPADFHMFTLIGQHNLMALPEATLTYRVSRSGVFAAKKLTNKRYATQEQHIAVMQDLIEEFPEMRQAYRREMASTCLELAVMLYKDRQSFIPVIIKALSLDPVMIVSRLLRKLKSKLTHC